MYSDGYNSEIEYLKRSIKRTYKRYIGERTDGEASLTDVTKLFKIPVDETRLQDYVIKNIDYKEKISIELNDTKENITYNANYYYTDNGEMYLLRIESQCSQRKIESLYRINDVEPFDSNMVISNCDGYKLKFRKQKPNLRPANCSSNRFTVNYLNNTDSKSKDENIILTKIFAKHDKEEINPELDSYQFDATYLPYSINSHNSLHKYCYIKESDGIVYYIEKICKDSSINWLKGLFCEILDNIGEYIPSYELDTTPYINQILSDKNNISTIVIACGIYKDIIFPHRNALVISKNRENIVINCEDTDINCSENNICKEFKLPILSDGKITIEEIKTARKTLDGMGLNDVFLDAVKGELNNFIEQLNTRDVLVDEQIDPLAPKLLMNKSFDEIYNMISTNKEYYFKLISEQFESITNDLNEDKKDEKRLLRKL